MQIGSCSQFISGVVLSVKSNSEKLEGQSDIIFTITQTLVYELTALLLFFFETDP